MADPRTLSKIGPFTFLTMSPPYPRPRLRTSVETRAGVHDYSVWVEGIRADPWKSRTFVDTLNLLGAETLSHQYHYYVGVSTVVTYCGIILPHTFTVLDVHILRTHQCVGAIGGVNGALGSAFIEAEWLLLPRYQGY